jgi:HTH-type transcriptional regulator, competence development regulator
LAGETRESSKVNRSPLGQRIKELRGDVTLRKLATELKIDFTYLSKIENGSDVPGEDVLRKMAAHFDVDAEELLGLAGKVPTELTERARAEPATGRLLRRLPQLSPEQMRAIYRVAGVEHADEDGK